MYLACLRKAPSISDIGAWEYRLPGLRCDDLLRRLCNDLLSGSAVIIIWKMFVKFIRHKMIIVFIITVSYIT